MWNGFDPDVGELPPRDLHHRFIGRVTLPQVYRSKSVRSRRKNLNKQSLALTSYLGMAPSPLGHHINSFRAATGSVCFLRSSHLLALPTSASRSISNQQQPVRVSTHTIAQLTRPLSTTPLRMSSMKATGGHSAACCNIPPIVSSGYQKKGNYQTLGDRKTYTTGPVDSASKGILV